MLAILGIIVMIALVAYCATSKEPHPFDPDDYPASEHQNSDDL